jgi:hypothetical protein
MTLTVRLDAALQAALDQHCAQRGVTKTLVVQECLAQYLVAAEPGGQGTPGQVARTTPAPSAAFRAFSDAGLIGAVAGPSAPADKAAVRQQARRRVAKAADAG